MAEEPRYGEEQHEPYGVRAPEERRPRRSREDRVIAGVAGGLGHYFGIDPVLVRVAFVALALLNGVGVLLYIVLWIVVPEAGEGEVVQRAPSANYDVRVILGGGLILLGLAFLLQQLIPGFDERVVWALVLVALGLLILFRGGARWTGR